MEGLVIEGPRARAPESGSRTLRNIIIVNAVVLAAAIAVGIATAGARAPARGRDPARLDGPLPAAGRRY